MNHLLQYQKVGIYESPNYSLPTLINDFVKNDYDYGLIMDRFENIIGFFTNKQLLHYCHHVGFEHIEDIESLSSFIKKLNKNFKFILEDETDKLSVMNESDLYIVKRDSKIVGVIDQEGILNAVSKKQQYELHHFKTMFNAVPSGIIAVNIEGIITMINPAAERLAGVRKEKALGQFITDVVPPDGLLRVLQTGQGHVEKYKVRKWWYVSYREPIYDGKRLVGAVGVFTDISKMEMLSTELETVKHLVKENEVLMEHSNHGIAIIDVQGNIIRQNRQFHQLYLSIINDMKQRMQLFQAIQDVFQNQYSWHEIEIKTGKGKFYRFQFTSIKEEGSLKSIIARSIEITKEKEQEAITQQILETHKCLFENTCKSPFIAESEEMKELAKKIEKIAKVSAPVLIKGEMGTGRSAAAKQIVFESERKDAPLIEIDCFGKSHMELRRMFYKQGNLSQHLFQAASGGTLYFKNIDYLPLDLQEQLANLLFEQARTKSQHKNVSDVRLMASISKELSFEGPNAFSERLYYLLNAIILHIPLLEGRSFDVGIIIGYFIEKLKEKYHCKITITENALEFLTSRKWNRNLQEIHEILEQYIVNFPQNIIDEDQLVLFLSNGKTALKKLVNVNRVIPLKQAVVEVEKELIELVSSQDISYRKMAKILEVNPSTIIRKVRNMIDSEKEIQYQED
ncbi:PAS domain S-box protein [Lysinibacillus yapensis]|uniref:PAS domain S-box protein n=1 Tax=Ureibacillus yapensis TaxID=2304605 RepID=A0A396SAN6_9BACL|nr:sigma 54-interacting transcriptional regulator [Lysinibacillus yapensis]RHW38408.1 PAS domain S-box protein [Lysinibacillus yapensis]